MTFYDEFEKSYLDKSKPKNTKDQRKELAQRIKTEAMLRRDRSDSME